MATHGFNELSDSTSRCLCHGLIEMDSCWEELVRLSKSYACNRSRQVPIANCINKCLAVC